MALLTEPSDIKPLPIVAMFIGVENVVSIARRPWESAEMIAVGFWSKEIERVACCATWIEEVPAILVRASRCSVAPGSIVTFPVPSEEFDATNTCPEPISVPIE